MLRISSGLRSAMLWYWGFSAMMELGHIRVYSGSQPPTADSAPTGTLLGYIGQAGASGSLPVSGIELTLDGPSMVISLNPLVLHGIASGEIGWWRYVWSDPDSHEGSTYYPRVDGAAGESLVLPDYNVAPGVETPAGAFRLIFPFE